MRKIERGVGGGGPSKSPEKKSAVNRKCRPGSSRPAAVFLVLTCLVPRERPEKGGVSRENMHQTPLEVFRQSIERDYLEEGRYPSGIVWVFVVIFSDLSV